MHRQLFLITFFFISLFAKATIVQQNEDETTAEEIAIEEINRPEQVYNDPRDVIIYDEEKVTSFTIDEATLRDYQNDDEFNYKEAIPEDTWWTRFKQKLNDIYSSFIRWLTGGDEATGVWRFVVEILPYLLMAGLLALFVYIFMKIDSGSLLMENVKAPEALISDDEELIQRQDLNELIDEAIKDGNYRLAVRFYYLFILQQLTTKDLIDWQVQKTNHDYIFEIQNTQLQGDFREVTDIYDYIWYGNFEVDKTAFAKAETHFKSIKNQL